ncbi:vegetatible incompatibility het-e-1 [Fusarium sporotrichioides]|uniref:Vegetatible incompatibility het-e-1 n=1 Tax=Fusarium sporotrichioides TaxID=5514 RepID=A0A395SHB7_FUSSP|nr:vegetatible incompatibility het-e-1 [Fusarium sporotrichioides]
MGKIATGCIAISTDAKFLATVFKNNIIRVWDLFPKKSPRIENFHPYRVNFLTMTSDDSTVVSACMEQVKAWDVSSGLCIETFTGSKPKIFRVATEDGSAFVMSGHGVDEVWRLNPLRRVQILQRQSNPFFTSRDPYAISGNGEFLALTSSHNKHYRIELWDVNRGFLLETLDFSPPTSFMIAFEPNGSRIAYTTKDSIEIRQVPGLCKLLVQIEDARLLDLNLPIEDARPLKFTSLTFHGQQLVAMSWGGVIKAWDIKTGKVSSSCRTSRNWLAKSFVNHDVLLDHVGPEGHLRDDVLKEFQLSADGKWVMRSGQRVLWLPPDYRPSVKYTSGPTVAIGTWSGRVFNLCMTE